MALLFLFYGIIMMVYGLVLGCGFGLLCDRLCRHGGCSGDVCSNRWEDFSWRPSVMHTWLVHLDCSLPCLIQGHVFVFYIVLYFYGPEES